MPSGPTMLEMPRTPRVSNRLRSTKLPTARSPKPRGHEDAAGQSRPPGPERRRHRLGESMLHRFLLDATLSDKPDVVGTDHQRHVEFGQIA